MEAWLILTILTIVFGAIAVNVQGYIMGKLKIDIYLAIFLFQIVAGSFFFILWIIRGGSFQELSVLKNYIPNLIFLVIFYNLVNFSNFSALKHIDSGKFSIIASTSNIFVIIFSSLWLGKTILGYQKLGVVIVFLGIVILNYRLLKGRSLKELFRLGIGEILALVGAISLGVAITNDGFMITQMNLYLYVAIAFILPPIIIPICFPKSFTNLKTIKEFFKLNTFKWFVFYMLSFILQSLTFYNALDLSGNPSIIASLTLSSVIPTGILAYIFLKEREDIKLKLLSAIITIIGLLIIAN
ncbi:MAG TPA: DMT family transporter [Candidatus Dojkabacteria bacterium]|nr:DMT family transporter [Candidatus Dojkabacteria bacterium]